METKNKIRIPHGLKIKTLLLTLGFLTPLLTSAWDFKYYCFDTISETCYLDDFVWLPNDQQDRRTTLHMHMLKDADVAFCVEVDHTYTDENGKRTFLLYHNARPEIDWINSRFDFQSYRKGQTIDFNIEVPYSQLAVGDIEQHLTIDIRVLVAPETVESYTVKVEYGYLSPNCITDVHHSFTNPKAFAGRYWGKLLLGTTSYTCINFKGLEDEYVLDSQGFLPLEDMHFFFEEFDHSWSPLTMKKGELRFYNYLDDFHIGSRKVDELKRPYIGVPLELVPEGKESYLRSKKFLYTKLDGRYQTNDYHPETQGYTYSTSVIMPPVKGTKARFYDCQIVLEGIGVMNTDMLKYSFTALRYSNEIGSKINSRYYVTEVKVDA